MSDETQNVALLEDAYRRWSDSRGASVDAWMHICADDIAFGSIAQGNPKGASYLTGYNGKAELKAYFEGLARDWEMMEYRVDHFVAQNDRVVMLGSCAWKYKKTGKVVWTPKADSWRFKAGKAVEYYEYYDTAQVHQATH